jgi:hypothetical protein
MLDKYMSSKLCGVRFKEVIFTIYAIGVEIKSPEHCAGI